MTTLFLQCTAFVELKVYDYIRLSKLSHPKLSMAKDKCTVTNIPAVCDQNVRAHVYAYTTRNTIRYQSCIYVVFNSIIITRS